jgi:hypothetical protein
MGRVGRVGGLGIATPAMAIAGFLACRQTIGIDQYFSAPADAGPDAGATACGLPFGTSTCAACAQAHCCAQSTTCAAESTFCAPYEGCLGNCSGDPACRSKCTIDHLVPADNAAPVSALSACLASGCETECGLTCGGFAGYFSMPDAAAGCATCLNRNACSNERACGSSVECDAFWRCYLACQTPDCQFACMPAHDAGAERFKPLYHDFAGTCATSCGYGSYWACLGRFSDWPSARSTTVTETWLVYDVTSTAGVPAADVQVCTSCPCSGANSAVLAHAQTDDAGYFSATYTNTGSPSGAGAAPCTQVVAPGYVTYYAYAGFPFTEPTVSMRDSLLPGSAWGLPIFKPADLQARAASVGGALDPTLGVVIARTWDCLSSPANGVDVTISGATADSGAWPYFDAGLDAGLTAQTLSAGNLSASAAFFNIQPSGPLGGGSGTMTAALPGRSGHVAQDSVAVQPNAISGVHMPPTP